MEADQSLARRPLHPSRLQVQSSDLLVTVVELPDAILARCTQADRLTPKRFADLVDLATKANLADTDYEYQAFSQTIPFKANPKIGSFQEDG